MHFAIVGAFQGLAGEVLGQSQPRLQRVKLGAHKMVIPLDLMSLLSVISIASLQIFDIGGNVGVCFNHQAVLFLLLLEFLLEGCLLLCHFGFALHLSFDHLSSQTACL